MAEGNRKDPRARVLNMTVRYKSATVDEFIENHSHDISKGGIFIKTRSPFPAGTLLKFEVRIAEDQRLMHGVGRVVWRREQERAEESFPAGMGIKFIKTGEGAAELISQIVAARQGVESSFDAGIRESAVNDKAGDKAPAGVPPALPSQAAVDALLNGVESAAAADLRVESGRGLAEAETQVSSPPKKRAHAPEKRKVVLQGPALDAPPSSKPAVAVAHAVAETAAEHAPSRAHSVVGQRATSFDETTSPRARASRSAQRSSPSVYGLIAIVGAVALVGVFIKRNRDAAQEQMAVEAEQASELVEAVPPPVTAAAEPALEPGGSEAGENAEGASDEAPAPVVAAAPAAPLPSALVVPAPAPSTAAVEKPRPPPIAATARVAAPVPAPPGGSAPHVPGNATGTAAAAHAAQNSPEKAPVTPPKAKAPVPDHPAAEATAPKPAAPKPAAPKPAAPKPVAPTAVAPTAPVAAQPPPTGDDNPY